MLVDAIAGRDDFNEAMNATYSNNTYPISDVSLRLVGIGTLSFTQGTDLASDYAAFYSPLDAIRSSVGADLALLVAPNRWTTNGGPGTSGACGGWPYLGTVGATTLTTSLECNQPNKHAIAHEFGHAYDLSHQDTTVAERTYRRAENTFKSLMYNTADGRLLVVSNGTNSSNRNNARRVHEVAATVAARGTFADSSSTAPGRYVPLPSPARVLDTRPASTVGGYTGPLLGTTIRVGMMVQGIPAAANAVAINITTVDSNGPGYVTVNDSPDWPTPPASIANFTAAGPKATGAIVATGEFGTLWVKDGGAGTTNVVIDVLGYFTPLSGSGLSVTTPARICDTRPYPDDTTGTCGTTPLGYNNSNRTIAVSSGCPGGATAAAVTITAVNMTGSGYLRVASRVSGLSTTAVLNYYVGAGAVGNLALVPLANGAFVLDGPLASTDVVVDRSACFVAAGLSYVPASSPSRIRDTRPCCTIGGGVNWLTSSSYDIVPTNAANTVALVNVVATDATAASFMVAWSGSGSLPEAATVNFSNTNPVRNNFAIAQTAGSTIRVSRGAQGGGNYLIVDQYGWFE